MGKTHSGICCVCGKSGNLTFEHIPPKKTNNNKQTKKIINPIAFFEDKTEFEFKLGNQKGMGDYTLCSRCNNYFGGHYATEFIPFYNELAYFFKKNYYEIIRRSNAGYLDIKIQANINFFRFQKQVVSMLMSTSKGEYKDYFKDYLLDEQSTNFPTEKFKIIMNGYLDFTMFNMNGKIIGANLSGNSEIVGSEIQAFPLGFTLVQLNGSEKEKNINSGLDITKWFNAKDCQQKKEFSLRTYTKSQPFPYYISGVTP
ncbi:hypothetical protein KIJ01_00095 [Leuconostoc gelidum subsp. gasicomitatum]|uniref:HNH endonuclease n=1 Tax=Leuconostoc gasicomitatum TaxID=115778 RepID=UPI001CCF27A6|nr:HNH endonuclease [Leuconostoc gasicomitatum]MBZ5972418.1 hypothetical protein [Leuconostoc gasicomitatum]